MKKVLLFTLLCVGQLYGMESERGRYKNLGKLSPEVQIMIIQSLNEYDNLTDIVKAIKATSLTNQQLNEVINDIYGNQKGFTALVHLLADKFPEDGTVEIASEFKTPAAQKYIQLHNELRDSIGKKYYGKVKSLIEHSGADVNSTVIFFIITPLMKAVLFDDARMVKLLLDLGANPQVKDKSGKTVLDYAVEGMVSDEVIKLLKDAMEK